MPEQLYSLPAYGRMIGDPTRFGAYRRALETAIRPGDVVVDLGAGPGILSIVAAKLGASRVWAVEPDPSLEVLPDLAERNGVDEIVRPVRGLSTDLELAQRADVLVSDLRGVLPFFGSHLPALVDARQRLLRRSGRLIPQRDEIWIAPVEAPEPYARLLGGFDGDRLDFDPPLDLSSLQQLATHHWCRAELAAGACLMAGQSLGTLDYGVLTSPHFQGRASWLADVSLGSAGESPGCAGESAGRRPLHGLAVWFDTHLVDGVGFSNHPQEGRVLYGQAFFPLPRILQVETGDELRARFSAHLVGGDYVFGWSLQQSRQGQEVENFEQSTFQGAPVGPTDLQRRASSGVPQPSARLRALAWLVDRVDGKTSFGALATELLAAFPDIFEDPHGALQWILESLPRQPSRLSVEAESREV